MNIKKSVIYAVCCLSFTVNCYASSVLELSASASAMEKSNSIYQSLSSEFGQKVQMVAKLEMQSQSAQSDYDIIKAKIEKYQELDDEDPGLFDAILFSAREYRKNKYTILKKVNMLLANNKARRDLLLDEVAAQQRDYNNKTAQYITEANQLINIQLAEKINSYKKVRQVIAKGTYNCSEDESRRQCQMKAKKDAEKKAIEKGSIIFINSITNMENFKIKKDITERTIDALIISSTKLKSGRHIFSEGDIEAEVHYYQLSAEVRPNFPPAIISNIRDIIQLNTVGEYNYLFQDINNVYKSKQVKKVQTNEARKKNSLLKRGEIRSLLKQAKVYLRQGNLSEPYADRAFQHYHKVLELDPYNSTALHELKRINIIRAIK